MNRSVSAAALRAALGALCVCGISSAAVAQSVPSPWTARDIGAPALSGSVTYASGVFTVDAAGSDIWGSSDQFHFVYQQISGDVDIIAKVDDLVGRKAYAKAGVMIRSSLAANAAHAYSHVTVDAGVRFVRRSTNGGSSAVTAGPAGAAPMWVRAVRQGTTVTAYSSVNGVNWTRISSATISLGTSAYVGIAVNSRASNDRARAVVSNVKVVGAGGTGALPSGQQSIDIGAPALRGSATYANGVYTVNAAGADIWDTRDQFCFVYQPVTGNVDVVARVTSIENTDGWSKAGVMIRDSLTAESRHAMMAASAAKGYAFQRRPDPGGYSEHTAGPSGTPPGWVRLVRTGDLFEAYYSSTGTSWTRVGSDTIAMGDTVYVGIAATSHNTSALATDIVDNLRITAAASTNSPPAVSITSPATGATITAPTTVTIAATATDPESRMASVEFYVGSTMIARDTTAPYSASWSVSSAGTYALRAVAHDADGGSTNSSTVNVTVQTSTNRPPTVSLSTGGILSFTGPATINLTATASDPEGRLARVEFFNGTTRLSTDTTAPYTYSWSSVPAGVYVLTAVAYDAAGASATSAALSVTVAGLTTAPRAVAFTASTDHATNVTNYVLKVFTAGSSVTTATPVVTSDLGKPTPASNGDITVDRSALFSALAVGNYVATVTAVGPGGQTQSASVSFTR